MSSLRASAAEFVPCSTHGVQKAANTSNGVLPPLVGALAQQHCEHRELQGSQEQHDGSQQCHEYHHEGSYYDNLGNWVHCDAEAEEEQHLEDSGQDALLCDPWAQDAVLEGDDDWSGLSVTTEQAVELLHTWYPTFAKPMLQQLYEACNYQLQDTLNVLAEMSAGQAPALKPIIAASSTAAERQPAGLAGDETSDWPTLRAAAATAQRADPFGAKSNGASNSTWATVAKKAAASVAPTPGPVAGKSGLHSRPRQPSNRSSSNRQQVPWVTTGAAVSQEYGNARAEASDHARVRNACFHQATIAYLAGNKALAKELSAQGKHAAQKMWEAHQRASQQIFIQRNAKLSSGSSPSSQRIASISSTGVIDLHGLHVCEVQAQLPQRLAALAAQKQSAVNIILGAGKHTKGPPGPRLLPAAEAMLTELGYSYRQPEPGLLKVILCPQPQ